MPRLSERRKELLTAMMQDAIYEAAVAVLTEHGISGLTMDRVAEKAVVAKGNLYNYFPTKLALLQLIHEKALDPPRKKGQAIIEADLPALEKLNSLIQSWFEYIEENRGLFSFLVMDETVRGLLKCEQETGNASAIQDIAAIVQQGIDEEVFRQIDPPQVAGFIFGSIRLACEQQFTSGREWSVAQLTEDLVDFFVHGLTARE